LEGAHHRGDAGATIEVTAGMRIQRLEVRFQELAEGRPLEQGGPCRWVGVQSYRASGLWSFESVGGGLKAPECPRCRSGRRPGAWGHPCGPQGREGGREGTPGAAVYSGDFPV
jgi:hypothetical protein